MTTGIPGLSNLDSKPTSTPIRMSEANIDYPKLKLDQVINESALTKSITFQGTYNGQPAVVRLEKSPFEQHSTKEALGHSGLTTSLSLSNDIYFRYKLGPPVSDVNNIQAIVVTPANEAVLAKYSRSDTIFFTETPDIYTQVVQPFIHRLLSTDKDYNNWIYNILEGRSETEHVILNDKDPANGFLLTPSLKSAGGDGELHILAICHRRDLPSMRDLNEQHLPLLKNILESGTKAIRQKYPSSTKQLRSYIHYHPTFYHFHVHFELVDGSEYKCSDRDNLLTSVISNITMVSDYYKRASLTYPLSTTSALHQEFKQKHII